MPRASDDQVVLAKEAKHKYLRHLKYIVSFDERKPSILPFLKSIFLILFLSFQKFYALL